MGVRGRREGMVRSSRALGVSWAMGLAHGMQMGAWDGPWVVRSNSGASHLKNRCRSPGPDGLGHHSPLLGPDYVMPPTWCVVKQKIALFTYYLSC